MPLLACVDGTEGGSCGAGPYMYTDELSEPLKEPELTMIRDGYADTEERCEAACLLLYENIYGGNTPPDDTVTACEALSPEDGAEDPWDPANTAITIACTLEITTYDGGCIGRRPHGHRELVTTAPTWNAWIRRQAHLERASVAAFHELASWLDDRSAPARLSQRCRASAADEVIHADLFDALLRREGSEPSPVVADPSAPTPLDVATHNATEGCVSEAFGALIAGVQAIRLRDPELQAIFGRLADDELRHGQLAWDLHYYLLSELNAAARAIVWEHLEGALERLPREARAQAEAAPLGLGWPTPDQAEALARSFVAGLGVQIRQHAA